MIEEVKCKDSEGRTVLMELIYFGGCVLSCNQTKVPIPAFPTCLS